MPAKCLYHTTCLSSLLQKKPRHSELCFNVNFDIQKAIYQRYLELKLAFNMVLYSHKGNVFQILVKCLRMWVEIFFLQYQNLRSSCYQCIVCMNILVMIYSSLPTDLHLRGNTIIQFDVYLFFPWHTEILELNYIAHHSKQFIFSSQKFFLQICLLFFFFTILPHGKSLGAQMGYNDKTNKCQILVEQNWLLQISLLTQQSEWHCPLNRMGLAIVSSVGESCVLFTSLVTTMRSQILHQRRCLLPLILTRTTAVSGRVWKRCRAQSTHPIPRVRTVSWDRYQELPSLRVLVVQRGTLYN